MTNKERLINNNTRIQECIDKANSLPSTKGKPIEITELDDSLLVPENEGRVYKYKDKLYEIKKSKTITNLKGATIKFNEHIDVTEEIVRLFYYDSDSDPEIGSDSGYEGFCNFIDGKEVDKNIICRVSVSTYAADDERKHTFIVMDATTYAYYYEYSKETFAVSGADYSIISGWSTINDDGYSEPISPCVVYKFDFPDLNENQVFVQWVTQNAEVIKYEFKEITNGKPIEVTAFDESDLVEENCGRLYKQNGMICTIVKQFFLDMGAEPLLGKTFKMPYGYLIDSDNIDTSYIGEHLGHCLINGVEINRIRVLPTSYELYSNDVNVTYSIPNYYNCEYDRYIIENFNFERLANNNSFMNYIRSNGKLFSGYMVQEIHYIPPLASVIQIPINLPGDYDVTGYRTARIMVDD